MNLPEKKDPIFHPMYLSFATPYLCRRLYEMGIVYDTMFKWKVVGDQSFLYTNYFDEEKIYAQALANEMFINSGIVLLPAYQIGELENFIPTSFMIEKIKDLYMVSIDKSFSIEPQYATRLPDAMAMMAIQYLNRKYAKNVS
jgi:hypothetical protein